VNNSENALIEMKGITKKFGNFTANENINMNLYKGEVLALLGENGAGKSTLMKVLYGEHKPTSGQIFYKGQKVEFSNPNDAISLGIGMVHQHFMLVEAFTVAQNIILGAEKSGMYGLLKDSEIEKEITQYANEYGFNIEAGAYVKDISVGQQQKIEILKALYRGADILILDEPTAVLTPQEIDELINIIQKLCKEGKTVLIITHKLKEIKALANRCVIIRRGKHIDTVNVSEVSENDLAAKMVGREVNFKVDKTEAKPSDTILEIKDLSVLDNRGILKVDKLNLNLRKGEILGIAGIEGNGQRELVESLTGLRAVESGEILKDNIALHNKTPRFIFDKGLSSIPEDRQKHGLVLEYSIAKNMILQRVKHKEFSSGFWLNFTNIYNFAKDNITKFDIRPNNEHYQAGALSGGNQQKVIIAREILNDSDILIAVQPTRGLDVGAIEYIHKALIQERDKGKAILLISFELDEVIKVSDRISVMHDGHLIKNYDDNKVSEKEIGIYMAGGEKNA